MRNFLVGLICLALLASCGGDNSENDKLVTIKTDMGEMTILLYEETPLHKANFIRLAESGAYDSTLFHRVINDFMIQGGDIHLGKGTQEAENDRIPAEILPQFYHVKGAVAAARQADDFNPEKKSSSCQFYIIDGIPWKTMTTDVRTMEIKLSEMVQDTVNFGELRKQFEDLQRQEDFEGVNELFFNCKDLVEETYGVELDIDPKTGNNEAYQKAGGGYPYLDKDYTVFGRVVEGLDVIDKIATVRTQAVNRALQNYPVSPIYIKAEVKSVSKKEITEKYGYTYPK